MMITARELDIMQVELDRRIEKLLEKFVRGHLGERMNNVPIANNQLGASGRNDGEEIYSSTGRHPDQYSGAVRANEQPITER
jgi:hypothetical protein